MIPVWNNWALLCSRSDFHARRRFCFCEIACTTAASRCTLPFAHGGGIPSVTWWRPVHQYLRVPLNAMMLSVITQIILGCIYFGSETAFNAFSSAGVIFLTVSYAIPIVASFQWPERHREGKVSSRKAWSIFAILFRFVCASYLSLIVPSVF